VLRLGGDLFDPPAGSCRRNCSGTRSTRSSRERRHYLRRRISDCLTHIQRRHRPAVRALDRTAGRGTEKLSAAEPAIAKAYRRSYQHARFSVPGRPVSLDCLDPRNALVLAAPRRQNSDLHLSISEWCLSRNWRAQPLLQCRCRCTVSPIDQPHFPPAHAARDDCP